MTKKEFIYRWAPPKRNPGSRNKESYFVKDLEMVVTSEIQKALALLIDDGQIEVKQTDK